MAHEAFLRAIVDNPDDDTARLVFADWLEERGDPRGEFIRLQYALEGMTEEDDRRWALEIRTRQLLWRHGKGWAGPLRQLVRKYSFRRGFAEAITLSATDFLQHGEELFRLAPILSVRLLHVHEQAEELARSPLPGRLTGLDLRHNWWNQMWRGTFPLRTLQLAGLRSLCLRGTGLCSGVGMRALASCPHVAGLHSLDLGTDSNFDTASIQALAKSPHLTRLRSLALGGPGAYMAREAMDCLLGSPLLARLTQLDVGLHGRRLRFQEQPSRLLALLSSSPQAAGLRRLRIHGHRSESPSTEAFVEGSNLKSLTTLELAGADFQMDSVLQMAHAALPSLKVLRLDSLHMGSQARQERFLATAPGLPRLAVLDLRSIPMGPDCIRALARGSLLPRLRSLTLAKCEGPSASFVQELTHSPGSAGLVHLDLSETRRNDADAQILAASPHLGQLLSLDLRNNRIGGPGAEALVRSEQLGNLVSLDLRGNPVPASSRALLRQRFGYGVRFSSR